MRPKKTKRFLDRKMNNSHTRLFFFFLFGIFGAVSLLFPQPDFAAAPPVKSGTLAGSFVVKDGGVMAGGQVLLYRADDGPPPLYVKYTRVPDTIIQIDAGNNFAAAVPVGEYYLLAVKRRSGEILGPPTEGDYGFRLMDGNGEWKAFAMREGEHLDLGALIVKFKGKREKSAGGVTTITGTLRDMEGKEVEHGMVFAFSTPQMQGNRPQFLSDKTSFDGQYILHVDGGATYYLLARDTLGGGQVAEGKTIGVYGNPEPTGITVQAGETVQGIDIVVSRMRHRGPVMPDDSGREPDPVQQRSTGPSWLPSTLPGSLQEDNLLEKKGAD